VSDVLALSFDVPKAQEPIDLVRELAFGLRSRYGGRAGQHWLAESGLDGIARVRVMLPRGDETPEASIAALWALVKVDLWCLREARRSRRPLRPLYDAICYVREPAGREVWQSTAALYQRGVGDCEDLTCARVAERLMIGDACRPGLKRQVRKDGSILYHVIIGNPDGTIEDPSRALGMTFGAQDDRTSPRCRRDLVSRLDGEGLEPPEG